MKNYKILLRYDGTRYNGWQKQPGAVKDNTIQGKLEAVLTRLAGCPVQVIGSGRTDAGVHALGQTANFHLETTLSDAELLEYINNYLPDDIAVTDLRAASARFHSRLNALEKLYEYRIYLGDSKPVFSRRYVSAVPEIFTSADRQGKLDLEAMKAAAECLCGTHDFAAFCVKAPKKKPTVRTITSLEIVIGERDGEQVLCIRIRGNGFLHHMVRIIVGTLLEVGLAMRPADEMPEVLASKKRSRAGVLVPAKGLALIEVNY